MVIGESYCSNQLVCLSDFFSSPTETMTWFPCSTLLMILVEIWCNSAKIDFL